MRIPHVVIALCAFGVLGLAHAQPSQPPGPLPDLPQAADACKGKAAGDTVTLTMPDGKQLQGVCTQVGQQLVARPPQPPGGKPPRPKA